MSTRNKKKVLSYKMYAPRVDFFEDVEHLHTDSGPTMAGSELQTAKAPVQTSRDW